MLDLQVDCLDVKEAELRGEPPSGDTAEHAATCPLCSRSRGAAPGAMKSVPTYSGLSAELDRERGIVGWVRSRRGSARVLLASACALGIVLFLALALDTRDDPGRSARTVLAVTTLGAALAMALRLGLRPLQSPPPSRAKETASALAGLLLPVALAVLPTTSSLAGAGGPRETAPGAIALCFAIGTLAGAFLVFALWALDRGAHGARRSALGAAIAGGLVANLALELHCASVAPLHLLLGHASASFALTGAYLALGWRRAG